MGAALARFVPALAGVAIPRGEKLGILVRLTNHNISGNREFIANSQRFAERRQTGKVKLTLLKPVFVDSQGSNFRFQSRGRNAELGCGP